MHLAIVRREVREPKGFRAAGKERVHPGVNRGPEIRFDGHVALPHLMVNYGQVTSSLGCSRVLEVSF